MFTMYKHWETNQATNAYNKIRARATYTHAGIIKSIINSSVCESKQQAKTIHCTTHRCDARWSEMTPLISEIHQGNNKETKCPL